ncbi:glycoside hydrolase domain-containing protein [Mucilaginibacter sp. CAU 1740]|uniref:glycoside hydrolase domain-containing protein n=1 Tax=Mucilaginibacter sp. CAU 1740 TaxID=3140365 RepID=UPI00325B4679
MKKQLLAAAILLTGFTASAQKVPYTNCDNCWLADSLGNHRIVLTFNGTGKVAKAVINWRRRDDSPENRRIIIEDAKTKQKITNVKIGSVNRESGELYFEPTSGKGEYFVYYMPYKNEGRSNYPKGVYLKPENTASGDWLNIVSINKQIPSVTVKEYQSIDAFNSFYPMEVIATKAETEALISKHKTEPFLIFPEDRTNSIRMTKDLPQRWIEAGPQAKYVGGAERGENFAFQLGVYALHDIENVKVQFSDLKSATGKIIPASKLFCINTGGITYDGKPLTKTVNVKQGEVQALWCGVDVPASAIATAYTGKATISINGKYEKTIALTIKVNNKLSKDGGVSEPYKMTRLGWLNSTMAQQNTVIAPYTPLQINGNTVSLLGRKVEVNKDGFPKQIQTYFTPEMTEYATAPNNLLTEGIHFHFINSAGNKINLKSQGVQFTKKEGGTVQWTAVSANDSLQMSVSASLEFDGFIAYTVKVKALQDVSLKDITMHIPFKKEFAKYMMGLGQKGGYRPDNFEWKWDVAHKNQDGAWIGNVNGGLQYSLRDEKYVRPLNTNFYLQKPLLLPTSWGNDNKGGIKVAFDGNAVLANNYSGARDLKKGDELYYNFTLLITPFHTINTDFQWATRFYHAYKPIDTIKEAGATLINIHHATAINPTINYPFIAWQKMKAYDDSAHAEGLKVKIYNTIRELSNHAYETFALRSLGHEIYSPGKGGGFSWLQEHVGDDYIAAWFVPEIKDAAIINSGMNRWHNYYVEGMNWLTQNVGIDGIYLDDVAFDRVTMKRIKRVLTKDGHPGIIDLHSANQYNKSDGFNNSANLYMEHFPYLNRLWFGEYFDYEKNDPDFFLTEVSGIPFGLMGEMLQGGGNKWRGMVYGMTNRMPWSDGADPRPIWKAWDNFGIKGTKMIGYWVDDNPVKTDKEKVIATVYKKKGAAMVAIASWDNADTDFKLNIDWKKLCIDPAKATITAPEIKSYQPAKTFGLNDRIPVEKGKGWLLIIK